MDKKNFLEKLKEILQCEDEISFETVLDDLDEWDSLGMMITAGFLDKEFGFKTTVNDLIAYGTVEEIYNAINRD